MTDIISSTDFRMQHFTIRELLDRINTGQLYCKRVMEKEWHEEKQVRFIESVLSGIPIASLYFNGSQSKWNVLDGVERLYAIECFVNRRLLLHDLELLSSKYETTFIELPPYIRRRFLDTHVIGFVLTTELPRDVLNSLFKRLNNL